MGHDNRVAVIVGGGSGVGRAIALRLAVSGWDVAALGRQAGPLNETVALIEARGGCALALAADAADAPRVAEAMSEVFRQFGRMDALVYAAGLGRYGPVDLFSLTDWEEMLRINLTGAYICTRHALSYLRVRGGAIIAIGSGAALQGYAGMAAYCAAKFGLRGYLQALAEEVGPEGVKVSLINPGSILTGFGGATVEEKEHKRAEGRAYLHPDDVAQAVDYLLCQPPGVWTQEMNLWPKTVPAHASGGEDSVVREEPSGSDSQPA